jgi:hypothetical protein
MEVLDSLLSSVRRCCEGFPDKRRGTNSHYTMADIGLATFSVFFQQFSFWWTGVRPKGHTGLEKDWAAILGRLGLIQGRDGGARQPAERRAALL